MSKEIGGKITAQNVNHPGLEVRLDAVKYESIKKTLTAILPNAPPGLTQKEMLEQVKHHADESLFPGGAKSGWWTKAVQLDLEAKGQIIRVAGSPLRWYLSE